MRPEVKDAMLIIEAAVNELLEKEPDALRGASIHGALHNIKVGLSVGDMYRDAVDKMLGKDPESIAVDKMLNKK